MRSPPQVEDPNRYKMNRHYDDKCINPAFIESTRRYTYTIDQRSCAKV